jgi:transcriptional regulator GlxA family with amidase domain
MPSAELHGVQVSLNDVWGGFAAELRERLMAAQEAEARFDLLEAALLQRLDGPPARHPAVAFALRELHGAPGRTIGEVRDQTGVSERRFIELFHRQVGLAPKLYARVRRFQTALRRIRTGSPVDWADIALACGYFDQAHLIHDFRAIAGLRPSEYAALRTEHLNHVPISA